MPARALASAKASTSVGRLRRRANLPTNRQNGDPVQRVSPAHVVGRRGGRRHEELGAATVRHRRDPRRRDAVRRRDVAARRLRHGDDVACPASRASRRSMAKALAKARVRRHERRERVVDGDDERPAVGERCGVRGAEEQVDVDGRRDPVPSGRPVPPAPESSCTRNECDGGRTSASTSYGHEDDDLAERRLGVSPLAQQLGDVAADAGARAGEAMAVDPQRGAQGSAVRSERPTELRSRSPDAARVEQVRECAPRDRDDGGAEQPEGEHGHEIGADDERGGGDAVAHEVDLAVARDEDAAVDARQHGERNRATR